MRLTEETESIIQNTIKNNLKSKKNKRSKNDKGENAEEKNDEVDMVALDSIKQNINNVLCGGIIIDRSHTNKDNSTNGMT